MSVEIVPLGRSLGAEVRGVDMRECLDPGTVARLRNAWLQHLVLVFRGQSLSDAELMAFSRQFGELELSPSTEIADKFGMFNGVPPEITVVSNIVENGRPIGTLGAGEAYWHTDSSFIETPPTASLLYSIEIPPGGGGNTSFCDMYAAYETLSPELKHRIKGRQAIHNFAYTSAGHLRKGFEDVTDVTGSPGARHPLVRTHPETGRKALFLGRRLGGYVVGLPVEESEELLDALFAHATQPEFVYEHRWRVGDVVMWDNRCTMHRRDAFDPSARRLLHRTQLKGARPN